MFLRTRTENSTKSFLKKAEKLRAALQQADTVLIGAGAGLSTAAGFCYAGARFRQYFSDFEEKYGFHDMYTGGFYPWESPEEYWAYWSRYILVNRYMDPPKPVYTQLLDLVRGKDCFVLTTNVDHCFQKAGFESRRLFCTQGDYGLFQCTAPCCTETFDNEAVIRAMAEQQRDMKIPSELIPRCPHCGRPLTVNLRADDRFVEDAEWEKAAQRYSDFLQQHSGSRMLLLELGVGYNTPAIIKFPFWSMTSENPQAAYACLNMEYTDVPPAIARQSISIRGDIAEILQLLQ